MSKVRSGKRVMVGVLVVSGALVACDREPESGKPEPVVVAQLSAEDKPQPVMSTTLAVPQEPPKRSA